MAKADVGGTVPTAPAGEQSQPRAERPKIELPKQKTGGAGVPLDQKTTVIYGQAGIGKSTLASQFPRPLFFDCAGELSGIEAYKIPVGSWDEFRLACVAVVEDAGKTFGTVVIDTADVLAMFVQAFSNDRLGIAHESDAEWGKGWAAVKNEFQPRLSKLAALPGVGVVLISHSKEMEIKTRRETYTKYVPTLTGGVRAAILNTSDLILYVDWAEDDEVRTIHTKPSRYHDAKERGGSPRLPEQVLWPVGTNGYEILNQHWTKETTA